MSDEALDDKALDESMTESIGTLLREIQARGDAPAEDAPDPAPEAEPEADPAETKDERPRDAVGRFVEKPKDSAAPADAPTTPPPPTGAVEPPAAEPVEELKFGAVPIDINRAPASWKPAPKAAWATLPEPIRREIYRRESDYANTMGSTKAEAEFARTIRATVEPYRVLLESERTTPERAIASLMQTAATLRLGSQEAKQAAVRGIMAEYGIQMPQAAPAAPEGAPAHTGDPRVEQLWQQQQQLMASLAAQDRARAQAAEAATNDAAQQFMSAVDKEGKPAHPYIDNVLEDMTLRAGVIRGQQPGLSHDDVLKQAYEQACWANPEVRTVLIAQQAATSQTAGEHLQKVETAKRAARFNVPRRGALPATEPALSLEEDIRRTGQALGMF